MTRESQRWCFCGIFLSTVLSVWSQSTSLPNSVFQYKAPALTRSIQGQAVLKHLEKETGKKLLVYPLVNQQEQYPYRQGYTSGPNRYQDSTRLNSQQPLLQQDFSQKTRNFVYADEPKPQLQSVDFTATSNHKPTYYPYQSNQKDSPFVDKAAYAKILNLAKVLSRHPRPDAARNYEPMMSASEVHEEICAPPKPASPPQNHPCTTPQPLAASPTRDPPCSQPQAPPQTSNPKPQRSQSKPLQPPASNPLCSQPKLETDNDQPPQPAPKFTPPKNPFKSDSPEKLSNTAFVSVSPLHLSSKHPEPTTEAPCTSTPCPRKNTYEHEITEQPTCQKVVPVVPAAKPVVHSNPFLEKKNEIIVPPQHTPKGVLHHRQHVDENIGYPEGYISNPETQSLTLSQVPIPYYVYPSQYQTVGHNPYVPTVYPYVPPPMTKPIPLVVPEDHEDDFFDVYYPVMEDSYHIDRPSRRYKDNWSKDVLRDIADKLGAILDDDFRGRRFSSRVYPDNERGYYDDFERSEDASGPYARGRWNYYEEDYDNDRRKERKYSRAG